MIAWIDTRLALLFVAAVVLLAGSWLLSWLFAEKRRDD